MTAPPVRVTPGWLALREPADAAARARELAEAARAHLPTGRPVTVHDLGCGTGSMARWLAGQLSGAQHWVMYDRDAELLDVAVAAAPAAAADGAPVTCEARQRDVTRLEVDDLADASLITASALLDMLTAAELDRLVTACAQAGCPVLITLSVTGRVDLTPPDPFDHHVTEAFNGHQRRTTGGGSLLGPDAVAAAADGFGRLGLDVVLRPSPWRLGPDQAALVAEWFTGWVGAACEHRPELGTAAVSYVRQRLAEATAGRLSVTVHHEDLLAWPR
jgi:SAM-dependent methyltransferase